MGAGEGFCAGGHARVLTNDQPTLSTQTLRLFVACIRVGDGQYSLPRMGTKSVESASATDL